MPPVMSLGMMPSGGGDQARADVDGGSVARVGDSIPVDEGLAWVVTRIKHGVCELSCERGGRR